MDEIYNYININIISGEFFTNILLFIIVITMWFKGPIKKIANLQYRKLHKRISRIRNKHF